MQALLALSRRIDAFSRYVGMLATWMVLLAALVSALNAVLRYSTGAMIALGDNFRPVFDIYKDNANTLRDVQLVLFAGMVMLGASWTLKLNEHVRVDLVYGSVGYRTRSWIDLIGGVLFLLPVCAVLLYFSSSWFLESWHSGEMSPNAGSIVPRWLFKLFIPLGFFLVLVQGLSEIIKSVAALTVNFQREDAYEKPVQ